MGLDDQIRQVADELEIRNLLARMAQLADDGELDEYIDLFTEDALWDGGAFGQLRGHASILEGARERRKGGTSGPGANSRHVITTSVIRLNGDTASSRSVFHFCTNTDAEPTMAIMGVYEDEFRRTPAGWKLAHRLIVRSDPKTDAAK